MTNIERFKRILTRASSVVITTHLHPDADGIGSQVALCLALHEIGTKAICVNEEGLLSRYHYLDPKGTVISFNDYSHSHAGVAVDLLIVVDTNTAERIGKNMANLAAKAKQVLFIDHHPCSEQTKETHCIDTHKAATGELVGTIIESIGVEYTADIALALYTAILIDTSSFRYPTVTADTHKMIAKLLKTGVRPPYAFNQINGTKRMEHMHLLGAVLQNTQMTSDGRVAWPVIPEETIKKYEIDPEDTHSYVNHLLILDNLEVACMFRQQGKEVKISFRSSGKVDVGRIAHVLGGGGHNHSAATVVVGKLDEVIARTVEVVQREMIKEK